MFRINGTVIDSIFSIKEITGVIPYSDEVGEIYKTNPSNQQIDLNEYDGKYLFFILIEDDDILINRISGKSSRCKVRTVVLSKPYDNEGDAVVARDRAVSMVEAWKRITDVEF